MALGWDEAKPRNARWWRALLARWLATGWLLRRVLMAGLLLPFVVDGGLLVAGRGGLFGAGVGVAVRELTIIAALLGFLLANARTLRRIDFERLKAMRSLHAAQEALQSWVDEQARVEAELRESERRFRFMADAMPLMLWTARSDGGVDYFNRRWSDYTGQTLDEAREWGWTPVIHPDDLDRCTRRWRQAFESGERYEIEYRFRRADGAFRWHLGRADAMRDENGQVIRWFGTCTDIDDQKRVETELRQAHEGLADRVAERTAALEAANGALVAEVAERKLAEEAARAASRAKGEFLANMSHEIRTPMNGILGMIELALGTALSPTQREYLGIVASSADSLLTVINDILDFSKIEAGKLALDPVPFAVRDALTDTLRSLALRAHDKGLELACRVAPDVPRSVIGDAGRLRQILVNLVGNAIKFTERGEVVVAITRAEAGADQPEGLSAPLWFSVSDTGIGIPPHKRKAIFAAFEQADGSTTRRYGGTGLGLAISAKLVALMGGTIHVEENPGGGSLFRFDAWFSADGAAPAHAPTLERPSGLDGLPVLVTDAHAESGRITEELLTGWGCRPVVVTDADETWDELLRAYQRGQPYAVLLLDAGAAPSGGLRLVARLRAREAASDWARDQPRLKVLMMTSNGSVPPDQPGLAGVDGWLLKPIRASELLDALLDLLATTQPTGEPGDHAALPDPADQAGDGRWSAPGATSPPDRPLEVLLAEDHPVNQRVASRMIEDLGHRVTVAGNGRAAVDAARSGRFDLVLMDIQMPELDGFEALAAIRGSELMAEEVSTSRGEPVPPHLPIIALTAHAMTGDRERCLNAGFDGYLSKPVNAAKLRAVFAPYLPNASPPVAAIVPPAPERAEPPRFDRRVALENLGGDEGLLGEIIRLFLDDSPRLLDQIRQAVDRDDHADLARLGHTLAGGASNFGPNPVIAAARRVERAGKTRAHQTEVQASAHSLALAYNQFQAVLLAEVGTLA